MKKMFLLVLAVLMVLSFASCGEKNPVSQENDAQPPVVEQNKGEKLTLYAETWEGEDFRLTVDMYYPEDAGIVIDGDEEYPNWTKMHYESKNITISPALFEDTTFDYNKDYSKENEDTYTEFTLNGYNCYAYEDFGGYWIYVHLEEVSENTDRYLVIDTSVIDYSKPYTEGIAHYEDEDIKKIIDSFVYNGVVEYSPVVDEAEAAE